MLVLRPVFTFYSSKLIGKADILCHSALRFSGERNGPAYIWYPAVRQRNDHIHSMRSLGISKLFRELECDVFHASVNKVFGPRGYGRYPVSSGISLG